MCLPANLSAQNVARMPRSPAFPGQNNGTYVVPSCPSDPKTPIIERCWPQGSHRRTVLNVASPAYLIDPISGLQVSVNYTLLTQ